MQMWLETSKARSRLAQFCLGNGVDLGYGGDPILPWVITVDLPKDYISPNLTGDARNLYWFKNEVLDFVYSSHLLEDFEDTETVLTEWLRVLKPGGYLVLFGPDQQIYKAHCLKTGQTLNEDHKIENFGLTYLKEILEKFFLGQYEIIHSIPLVDQYSFDLVLRKK